MLLTTEQIALFKKAVKDKKIKVIVFDLETSPSKFWGWGTGEQYVDAGQLVTGTETKIITTQYLDSLDKSAKYLEWDWMGDHGDDTSLVEETIRILNQADLIIGQNSKAFDIKVLQERAKVLRLEPVNIDFMMDTLTHSRSSFKSLSHKLDYRSKQYGLGGKHKMTLSDWIDIVEGRVSPSKKMIPYGLKDVMDTDKIFWRDLPYYNLSKAMINKILKLVLPDSGTRKVPLAERPFCKPCAKKRQRRFDLEITDKEDSTEFKCKNCEHIWSAEHETY